MSRHQYPRIGAQRSYPLRNGKRQKGPPCIVCGAESWCKVFLETSHMRGDDEVVHACVGHKDDANALWAAFEQRQKARADVAVGVAARSER